MKALPTWRKVFFWTGVFVLLCVELFEFALPHIEVGDGCGDKSWFLLVPFAGALLAFLCVLFGKGWWRGVAAVVTFAGFAFWGFQIAEVAGAC